MNEIKKLLAITQKLRDKYIHLNKQFSLDGKLVGDIGEVLVAEKYGLELYSENTPIHDAFEKTTNRKVQIKSTMKGYCYFPFSDVPDYFISVRILEDGKLEELFNGSGQFILEHYIQKRNIKPYRKSYYSLSIRLLEELNKQVEEKDKIKEIKK